MTNPANVQAAALRHASVVRERRHAAARRQKVFYAVLLVIALLAPLAVYPVFLMKLLCFALFACAFNLGCCPSAMRRSSPPAATSPATC